MATQLPPDLIERAANLRLFEGVPSYYFPDGNATPAEHAHLVNEILKDAIERIKEFSKG